MISITPVYAALCALFFVFLSMRVIRLRIRERVSLGDAGNRGLRRAVRVHGNFAEYAVFGLLLMALAEAQGAPAWQVHLIGGLLLLGRAVHAVGLSSEPQRTRLRVAGMLGTLAALIVAAVTILVAAA